MSRFEYTDEDLKLYAKVLFWRSVAKSAIFLAIYFYFIVYAGFSVFVAFFIIMLAAMFLWAPLYFLIRYRVKRSWHRQSPDRRVTLKLTPMGWAIHTKTTSKKYSWMVFSKRIEVFGCYVFRVSRNTTFVYRKDYFDKEEQHLIEVHVPKSRFGILG